jgi:phage baseplate assembly protein gpV
MANRYWVGGSGNWDTTTTNWSTTSGGAGGASAPTSADSVFFDQAGTYTVTFGSGTVSCLNFSNTAGTVTFTGAVGGQTFACYGNFTLSPGASFSNSGYIYFYNNTASTTNTITTNGVTITPGSGYILYFSPNTTTSTIILGSALTVSGYTYIQGTGIWDTGGFAVTTQQIYVQSGTPTINLNASTITLTTYSMQFTVPVTLNAGTSTINHTLTSLGNNMTLGGIAGSSYTFYNISFIAGPAPCIFSSNITCNNLTVNSPTTAIRNMFLGGSLTVNGTFSGSGSAVNSRIAYVSYTVGTAQTMTIPVAYTSISNADFRDITATNAITVTNGGNCGGNTNITGFAAAKTVYWNLAGAQNWSATGWASTSGGTPSSANFPLAQDTAIFDNTGSVTGTISIEYAWNIGSVVMSARTTAMTLAVNITRTPYIHGSWLNGTGVTLSGTGTITFAGRSLQQVSGNGVLFTQYISIQTVGGIQLTSALTTTGGVTCVLTSGTLDLNGNTLTSSGYFGTGVGTKNLTFNGGTLVCTATTTSAFYNLYPTGFTTTAGTGTGTISMTGAGAKTFIGGGSTFNCTLNQGGAGTLTITGANTFNNITNTVQPATVIFPASTITRFLSNFQLSGTSGNLITINSSISGTAATLSLASGTVADNYLSIKDSTATGGATWYAGANSTNVSNVSGWIFANSPVYLIFSGMQISGGVTIF